MIVEALIPNQVNLRKFVLVDAAYAEVTGLGSGFNLEIHKPGGAWVAGTGTKAELGNGWYSYEFPAAECDTVGPLAVRAWDVGTIQQNLEYIVRQPTAGCIEFTYTLTVPPEGVGDPIADARVSISTNNGGSEAGSNIVWIGYTDAFGVARDSDNNLPCLDPGTYYFWRQKTGYTFSDPDTEVVS